jgi:hypothetical protein
MLNNTTNARGPISLSKLDALFRWGNWLTAGRAASDALHRSPADAPPGTAEAEVRAKIAGLCTELGFPPDDPACAGIGKSDARAVHAVANITDWLTYLPRDCVRAMVKDGWHWST